MIYHAARACAVGGYIDLYKELDPLPEMHIAEEAGYAGIQRSSKGSQEIYQYILSQPVKFAIMNDYERTVDIAGRQVASLNGDTAVCSSLTDRSKFSGPKDTLCRKRPWVTRSYFDITEDWGIDDHDCEAPKAPEDDFPLVYSPLPTDLPLINKDNLIYVAAYIGDVDRYARLRRPEMLKYELGLVIRGIYHNAFFAKWWSTLIPEQPLERGRDSTIRCAINARRIMSNDLSWVTASSPSILLPEMIWYPAFAARTTYEKLAYIQPKMFRQCLQACIAAGYVTVWDRLLLAPPENVCDFQSPRKPDESEDLKLWRISRIVGPDLWNEAEASRNKHFLQEISAAVPKKPQPSDGGAHWWHWYRADSLHHPVPDGIICVDGPIQPSSGDGPYDGIGASIGDADHAVFVMDAVGREIWEEEKKRQHSSYLTVEQIYELIEANKASK